MTTPAYANHAAADIQVSNANAALAAAEAVRRLATTLYLAASETETDAAFVGLQELADAAETWANELARKGMNYRKGLI